MKKAVLFDLDGTLVDSIPDIAAAMNRALSRHGLPQHPLQAYRTLTGNGAAVLAQRAVGEREALAESVLKDFLLDYAANSTLLTRAYPGVPELLSSLRERGFRLCVLSNKEDEETRAVVRHCFEEGTFTAVRGRVPGTPLKPDPAGALWLAEQLRLPPAAFFYVGDTLTDIRCAKDAGMAMIAVTWGYTDRETLARSGADLLAQTPGEVLRLVSPL